MNATRVLAILALVFVGAPARADRLALWTIVHGQCAPHMQAGQGPGPCERVDLSQGEEGGVALLKDLVGVAQFLAIPTRRVTGIEDPFVLDPAAPDYFAFAWAARDALAARLGRPLAREAITIAINSQFARSQDQFHLHIDCLDGRVAAALADYQNAIDDAWRPMAVELKGRVYWARRVLGEDLAGVRPLNMLADGLPGAKTNMSRETLAVVGARFDGKPAFILLADRTELSAGGHAEDLQDHSCATAPTAP
ncbi:MAG: CDP-diacylglycerol diphosphatase [Bradyrhizobium sp.]|nr:MAG: CDP-diacylglycerol diphosphatase [Bradyrhizobium sp.]